MIIIILHLKTLFNLLTHSTTLEVFIKQTIKRFPDLFSKIPGYCCPVEIFNFYFVLSYLVIPLSKKNRYKYLSQKRNRLMRASFEPPPGQCRLPLIWHSKSNLLVYAANYYEQMKYRLMTYDHMLL